MKNKSAIITKILLNSQNLNAISQNLNANSQNLARFSQNLLRNNVCFLYNIKFNFERMGYAFICCDFTNVSNLPCGGDKFRL
ncbi:hypothetical protein [Helicobacter sp. 23-1045]